MDQPHVYIVAGPNGAGKTTFARTFLPRYANCKQFVNADLIAQGLAPFAPETVGIRAGRVMLQELRRFAASKVNFGFEATLSGRSFVPWLREIKARGYIIELFFLWLPSVESALDRIAERVRGGGHNVRRWMSGGGITGESRIYLRSTAQF
jgi:predicted ABC-type ATPase